MTQTEKQLEKEVASMSALMSAWLTKQKRLEREVAKLEKRVTRLETKMAAMQTSGVPATDGHMILDVG